MPSGNASLASAPQPRWTDPLFGPPMWADGGREVRPMGGRPARPTTQLAAIAQPSELLGKPVCFANQIHGAGRRAASDRALDLTRHLLPLWPAPSSPRHLTAPCAPVPGQAQLVHPELAALPLRGVARESSRAAAGQRYDASPPAALCSEPLPRRGPYASAFERRRGAGLDRLGDVLGLVGLGRDDLPSGPHGELRSRTGERERAGKGEL